MKSRTHQETPQEEHKKCPIATGQARQVHPELCSTSLCATNGPAPQGTAGDESSSLVIITYHFFLPLFLHFQCCTHQMQCTDRIPQRREPIHRYERANYRKTGSKSLLPGAMRTPLNRPSEKVPAALHDANTEYDLCYCKFLQTRTNSEEHSQWFVMIFLFLMQRSCYARKGTFGVCSGSVLSPFGEVQRQVTWVQRREGDWCSRNRLLCFV